MSTLRQLDKHVTINKGLIESPNLCDRLSTEDLTCIGEAVWNGYARDKASRSKWEKRMDAALDLALQVQKAKTFPWPGSSNVVFPLITIAALQFSARAYSGIIQGTDVVRYRVIGEDKDGKVAQRATRIGRHMSWQCLEEDEAWEEQHDRELINLAIIGCNFMKSYLDATKGYPVSELVMAQDFVIDYWAKSTESAARKTQRIALSRNDIYEKIMQGTFKDVRGEEWYNSTPAVAFSTGQSEASRDNRMGTMPATGDEDTPFITLEQHRFLDLDGDGYAEPYIVTIEEGSHTILRITARFETEEDVKRTIRREIISIKPTEYYTKYSFIPSPDGGIYDLGFGIFLGPINEAVNSGINQLLDNGTMQNSIGGFLGRGLKIRGGIYTMAPWEFKRVDSYGDDIRKNLVMFPDRQPSDVMFKLIGLLIDYANRIAGTVDATVGENPGQNTPAQSFQGMQEQGMQVYGMIFKRVWRCMKEEFKKRYQLNRMFLSVHQRYGAGMDFVRKEDYIGSPDQIAPVADPNVTSTVMRITQALAVLQEAKTTPGFSIPEAVKGYLRALRIENIDQVYPGPDNVPPLPNWRTQVETLKLQGKQMELKAKTQEWANHLMEERRLNQARIHQLEAQAAKLLKEAGNVGVAERLSAFEMAMSAMQAHGEMLNDRLKILQGESDGQGSDGKGVPRLAGPPGNSSASGDADAGAGGAEGAVGDGGNAES